MKKINLAVLFTLTFAQLSIGSMSFHYLSEIDSLAIIEKVYLHVDRDIYYAGDNIWFKAYLINATDRLLSNHSGNLHVELISPSLKIVSARILRLEDGKGNGDFTLPKSIKSGKYKLRAYTNYMRNFDDQLFFTKDIMVINTDEEQNEIRANVKYVDNKIQLSFFPEGGSMVDNVSSLVAFKAVNYLDNGCDVSGKIYSSAGNLITGFKSVHCGMGSFFLRPLTGLTYYAIYKGADSVEVRAELPVSFPTGITMGVTYNQNNDLLISVKTNPETLQRVENKDLSLSFLVRKEVFQKVQLRIKYPVTNYVIPVEDLPEGVMSILLSGSDDLPLSERLVFIKGNQNLNIHIETDKLLYNKRDPVSLRLSLTGDSSVEREANVSLAAVDTRLIATRTRYPTNISSWFLLESDVHGFVEDPSYYFDSSNTARFRDLDLLLRTQGWRDFAWKYDTTYFAPENGFEVSGRLRRTMSNKPISGSSVSIGIFDNDRSHLTLVPVDSSGRFRLSGIQMTGAGRLIVSGNNKKDSFQGLVVLDSVAVYKPAKVTDSISQYSLIAENKLADLKTTYKITEAIKKNYKLSDTIGLGQVEIISEKHKDFQTVKIESSRAKYVHPDNELIITEQMQGYPYLIEVLRGRIPGLEVLGYYPNYSIRIRAQMSFHGATQPLVLVDGHQASFEDLFNIPINFIDRLDVIKSGLAAIFGVQGSNGVINIITKTGTTSYKQVSYTANIKFSGYNAARIFYSPQHVPGQSSAEPDIRSTLYWKPDIDLDSKETIFNYYNCDNSSKVKITVEGISTTGIPVTGTAEYEVK